MSFLSRAACLPAERRAARRPLRRGRGEVAARAPGPTVSPPRTAAPSCPTGSSAATPRRAAGGGTPRRSAGTSSRHAGSDRENEVLVAEPLHVLLDLRLVRLDGEEAVEAVEAPRRPAAVAREEADDANDPAMSGPRPRALAVSSPPPDRSAPSPGWAARIDASCSLLRAIQRDRAGRRRNDCGLLDLPKPNLFHQLG